MIRKQQPYGLLKTAGHFASMPRRNVNSEELSYGRAFEFPPTHQTDTLADSRIQPETYSTTDRIREQYTVIRSDVGTPHFFIVLSA